MLTSGTSDKMTLFSYFRSFLLSVRYQCILLQNPKAHAFGFFQPVLGFLPTCTRRGQTLISYLLVFTVTKNNTHRIIKLGLMSNITSLAHVLINVAIHFVVCCIRMIHIGILKHYNIAYSLLKMGVSETPKKLLGIYVKVWFSMEIAFVTVTQRW